MKILFSITYYHPYISGLTLAASRWAEGLAATGEKVTVLCMKHSGELREIGDIKGVRVKRAKPILKISKGFVSWDWVVKSWQQVQKHDVIVVNLPQFEGVIPALFAKIFHKKVIVMYHCEIVIPWLQRVIEASHLLTLLLADVVVTYTRDYADSSKLLRLLKLPRSLKMKYIVPPIPKPKENKALTKKLQKTIGKTDFVIGVAARLAREKGIEYLLEAMPLLLCHPGPRAGIHENKGWIPGQARNDKWIKIAIAGPMEPVGEESYKEKIMTVVRKYRKQVIFLGSIPPEYMGSFYKLIDVLVLPSINSTEAFGMVQVEAMRWGVPVIASDLPGVRVPVLKTGMGIVVPPRDSRKLAEAIIRVLSDKSVRARVERFFSEKQSVDAMHRVISGLTATKE